MWNTTDKNSVNQETEHEHTNTNTEWSSLTLSLVNHKVLDRMWEIEEWKTMGLFNETRFEAVEN